MSNKTVDWQKTTLKSDGHKGWHFGPVHISHDGRRGDEFATDVATEVVARLRQRKRLPQTRCALTRKIKIGNWDLYVTVGFYEYEIDTQPRPGEVFVRIGKNGSTMAGIMNAWAITLSVLLQTGYDWGKIKEKYLWTTFEPHDDKNPSVIHAIAVAVDDLIQLAGTTNAES